MMFTRTRKLSEKAVECPGVTTELQSHSLLHTRLLPQRRTQGTAVNEKAQEQVERAREGPTFHVAILTITPESGEPTSGSPEKAH
jgi:hypothetical protein